jgi:hypothetical protein
MTHSFMVPFLFLITYSIAASFVGDTDEVALFLRQAYDGPVYLNLFSVVYRDQTSVKSRAIVSYTGDDTGSGKWVCQKDRGAICGHIVNARHELQKLVHVDPTARDCNSSTIDLCELFLYQ